MRPRYFVGFRQGICKFFWRYCGIGYPQCPPLFLYKPAWQAPRVSLAPIPIQTPAMLASHAPTQTFLEEATAMRAISLPIRRTLLCRRTLGSSPKGVHQ